MAEHAEPKDKTSTPAYVRVVANATPDKAGLLTQAGQIYPATRFANVADLIAAHALAPVDPADVVLPDAEPTAALLETLRGRHAHEDTAWAKTQAPPVDVPAPAKTEE